MNRDEAGAPWYRDAATRSLILRRYLPWLAVLSLGWEIAQLPLYTLWNEAGPGYIAFAVAHCTIGDILIGTVALALSLVLMRAGSTEQWPRARRRMAAAIDVIGGRGEPHVVVLGPGRLGPFAVLVHRKAVVARDHQPLAVHAVREAVHVNERDRTLRRRNCGYAD